MGRVVDDTPSSDVTAQMASAKSGKVVRRISSGSLRTSKSSRRGSYFGARTFFNIITRLITWYALYSVLFRCPANPTPDSPQICYSANVFKRTVKPHVQPYYDTYVFPLVRQYSPYVQQANKQYFTPTYETVHATYIKYGQPYISTASDFATTRYDQVLKPHVSTAQAVASFSYTVYFSPHVKYANQVWFNIIKPTIDTVESKTNAFWKNVVTPTYSKAQPHITKAYENGRYFIAVIVAPLVKEAGERTVVWGQCLWSEVVRPQVGRIGERLGGVNGNGTPVSPQEFSSSTSLNEPDQAGISASVVSMVSSISAKASASAAPRSSENYKKLTKEEVEEMIGNDVNEFMTKFNTALEKSLADFNSNISEIIDTAHEGKNDDVEKQLYELENMVLRNHSKLRSKISSLTKDLISGSSSEALETLHTTTEKLGLEILERAKSFRSDANIFLTDVYDTVSDAMKNQLVMLRKMHETGLEDIGMRWALLDGVSFKDWEKYHELTQLMKHARSELYNSVQENTQLKEFTKWVDDDWSAAVLDISINSAKELKHLKEIGRKMILLGDGEDNIGDDSIHIVTEGNTERVLGSENVQSGVEIEKSKFEGSASPSFGTFFPIVSELPGDFSSQPSMQVHGSEPNRADIFATAVSEGGDTASTFVPETAEQVKVKVAGGVHAGFVGDKQKIVYEDDDNEMAHEFILQKAQEVYNQLSSSAADSLHAATRVREVSETDKSAMESIYSVASQKYSAALSTAEASYSSFLSAGSNAKKSYQSAIADAERELSDIVSTVSTKVYGTPEPVSEGLLRAAQEKYSQAQKEAKKSYDTWFSAASTKLYGTPTLATENLASAVSSAASTASSVVAEQASNAASVASGMIYGVSSHAGVSATASSIVSEAAASITSAAEDVARIDDMRYAQLSSLVQDLLGNKEPTFSESVMSRLSSAVYGTPTPILSQASTFAASVTAAAARAAARMPPAVDEMISDAINRVKSTAAEASAAIYGKELSQFEKYQQNLRALGHEAVENVRVAVYGTPKGTFEQATETLASMASEATKSISSVVDGAMEAAHIVGVKIGLVEADQEYKEGLIDNAKHRINAAIELAEENLRAAREKFSDYADLTDSAYDSEKDKIRDEL